MFRRAITTLSFSAISFVLPLRRMPAVSTKTYSVPPRITLSSTASRVVPAIGDTIARSCPVSAFSSVDLPTFGRPMIATLIALGLRRLPLLGRALPDAGQHVIQQRVDPRPVLRRHRETRPESPARKTRSPARTAPPCPPC